MAHLTFNGTRLLNETGKILKFGGSSSPTYEDPLTTGFGYLYNFYAVSGGTIAADGWHVPSNSDFNTLITYIGGATNNGDDLKVEDYTHWNNPNIATNLYGFNAKGAGYRRGNSAAYELFMDYGVYFSSDYADGVLQWLQLANNNDDAQQFWPNGTNTDNWGYSVKLIKDSTTLSHGQTSTYTGNDGTVYPTICIGTQEWLADNLKETQYSDSSSIPLVTGAVDWVNTTLGARDYPNGDSDNV